MNDDTDDPGDTGFRASSETKGRSRWGEEISFEGILKELNIDERELYRILDRKLNMVGWPFDGEITKYLGEGEEYSKTVSLGPGTYAKVSITQDGRRILKEVGAARPFHQVSD